MLSRLDQSTYHRLDDIQIEKAVPLPDPRVTNLGQAQAILLIDLRCSNHQPHQAWRSHVAKQAKKVEDLGTLSKRPPTHLTRQLPDHVSAAMALVAVGIAT
jgi:hypothetical protein